MPAQPNADPSLGTVIRDARRRTELSQNELATRLGVSQGTISFWERDVEAPSLENLVKLLAVLPNLAEPIRAHNSQLIEQLRQIERALFDGGCACENCHCKEERT